MKVHKKGGEEMAKKYYSLEKVGQEANINIYGDIGYIDWDGVGVLASNLKNEIDGLEDVSTINVYINSYGGVVSEGLAIYNALKRHKAKVKTYCDGFAASIASVIFMAGDERIMSEASLLMIHNAWTWAEGNAEELRKLADDLEKITQASVNAYKAHSTLSEEEIKDLMDNETWITPEEAIEYGFATSIEKADKKGVSQNAKMHVIGLIKAHQKTEEEEAEEEEPNTEEEEAEEENGAEEETEKEEETEPSDEGEEEKPEEKVNEFFKAILRM